MDKVCSVLADRDPSDPLLHVLSPLNGNTKKGQTSICSDSSYSESLHVSVGRAAGVLDAIAAIVSELERCREDRQPGAVAPLRPRGLQEDIEQMPEDWARRELQARFLGMEAAIMTAHLARPAPSRKRDRGRGR